MAFTVDMGPCECCPPGCECPLQACDQCSSGYAALFLSMLFDDIFAWSSGAVVDATPPNNFLLTGTSNCEWTMPGQSSIGDTYPPGTNSVYAKFYYHAGSGTWRLDVDFMQVPGSYTPTNYLITYELTDDYVCCAEEFTTAITRIAGPSGGLTITTEPTEVTIFGCGCCFPIATDCCEEDEPTAGSIFAEITSACDEIDGLIVELVYKCVNGTCFWEGSATTDCVTCHTVTITLTCTGGVWDFNVGFSGNSANPSPPPDTLNCNVTGQGAPCVKSLDWDCETQTGEAVYCLASLGNQLNGSACCLGDPTTITFTA